MNNKFKMSIIDRFFNLLEQPGAIETLTVILIFILFFILGLVKLLLNYQYLILMIAPLIGYIFLYFVKLKE
jgi:hypothetical protein